jgi:hypothetical protein
MRTYRSSLLFAVGMGLSAAPAIAQEAVFVHRLGRDTMAVEQYTRTGNRLTGEVASRMGGAVTRMQYEVTLANDGRPLSAVYRMRSPAGAPLPNQPTEVRLTFAGDSVRREAVFADSTNVRTLPAARGIPFQQPAFGLWETAFMQMRRGNLTNTTFATVSSAAATPGTLTVTAGPGDTIRVTNQIGLSTIFRADREGRLLSVDASNTTQKLMSTRGTGGVDLNAIASRMTPAGQLSQRGSAFASFRQSVVFASYGRPLVRDRTVWGGMLIPPDTIWRMGANEAAHLAVGRELTFGNVVVPPGLYTMWLFNARGGPQLVINRQVGQWGTVYNAAQDLGRIPMTMSATPEHVEEFTINIRNLGNDRGAIELAWGPQMATAQFTVRAN